MLRVVAHTSAAGALRYYTEGLKKEDYYSEGQEMAGKWYGKAAALLGLSGDETPEVFAALVHNRHPLTGEKLTPRTNENRRVGFDLSFHAPKSLSVLYALTQDKEVLSAYRQAVADTMAELEQRAETRVRKGGARTNRATGNLVWAEFVHFTARPVNGIPDPHLHIHCFTFNCTFDDVEKRWKAAELGALMKDVHYAEAAFHARLTCSLAKRGYGIARKKGGWEIAGMPASVIAKFSQRTAVIERKAQELGIKDAKAKDALGAATRESKNHGMTFPDLLAAWSMRLTEEEKVQISRVCYDKGHQAPQKVTPVQAMDYAVAKLFERQSVVRRGHILAAALRFGAGHTSPEAIKAEFEQRQFIGRKIGDEHWVTSREMLAEEIALLAYVRSGRNTAMRLGGRSQPKAIAGLSAEQNAAMKHLLTSRDQVMIVRGAAGAGKTTMMVEACAAVERQGMRVFAFAPSAAASRGTLREAGFSNATTVAHLLVDEKLQKRVRGQVIWIDEAGLLGVHDLWRILEIVGPDTRLFLTGDAAQHAPVAWGDMFRLLQKYAGLKIAEVTEIRRQVVEEYRLAITALSKGNLRAGFRHLEKLGAFVEIEDDAQRYQDLAADYLALGKYGKFPLVVSPTHAECTLVTAAIRSARREAGQLGPDRMFCQYVDLKWEEVERSLPENFQAGLVVQFNQKGKGIKRGEIFRVIGHDAKGGVQIQNAAGLISILPQSRPEHFEVYEERVIALAKGDRIRITRNGRSQNGKRLDNGNGFAIEKFGKNGEIILSNGAILNPDHGHIADGYCQTSHASQSKSVRDVLVAQSKKSLVASSREQFYVSASRGKETIRIYTDDRQQLQAAVGNTSTRMAGMELAGLTSEDITNFMSSLGAKEWRDHVIGQRRPQGPVEREKITSRLAPDGSADFRKHVASRRGGDGTKAFAKHLSEQRKVEPRQKGEVIEWKGYVEMRRNIAGADGKSRSKGYNAQPNHKGAKAKGKSLPKISQHSKAFIKENAERGEAKKAEAPKADKKPTPPKSRVERLTKAYRSAAKHFQKVAEKVRGPRKKPASEKKIRMGNATIKPQQKGGAERAAKHAAREMEYTKKKTGDGQNKTKEKGKQAAPRAPIIKK